MDQQGCLVVFFTNFLALIIQAEVAQADSSSSAAYSVVLIIVQMLFVLSIFYSSYTETRAGLNITYPQVRIKVTVELVTFRCWSPLDEDL